MGWIFHSHNRFHKFSKHKLTKSYDGAKIKINSFNIFLIIEIGVYVNEKI